MAEKRDYYEILGIPKNATAEEIKKAYRKLAHQFHPDKNSGSAERFKEINEAYQILGDEERRRQYDQFGHGFGAGQAGGFSWGDIFGRGGRSEGFDFSFGGGAADFDVGDIFESIFGNGEGKRDRRRRRGRDLAVELSIPFEMTVLGGRESIEVERLVRCSHCNGTGAEVGSKMKQCPTCEGKGNLQKTERTILGNITRVETCIACRGRGEIPQKICATCKGAGIERKRETIELTIPKGVRNEDTLKLSGKGDLGAPEGLPGDLFIRLRVLPHKIFRRQGDDLLMTLPLKVSQAILGDTVGIETFEGKISLRIPEGSQSGEILRIRGKGVPKSDGYGRGDLLIELRVEIPRKPSRRIKDAIEGLKDEGL